MEAKNLNTDVTLKVLVVEDEAALREIVGRAIAEKGHTVSMASSGNEAFEIVQKQEVQLIISDIRMANGSGLELLENIKKTYPQIPVVLMTGYSDFGSADIMKRGGRAVIHKPFRREVLFKLLIEVQNEFINKNRESQ